MFQISLYVFPDLDIQVLAVVVKQVSNVLTRHSLIEVRVTKITLKSVVVGVNTGNRIEAVEYIFKQIRVV